MTSVETHRHTAVRPWTYADLERRQNEVREGVLRGEPGRLIFSEVAPVVTLGYRKTKEDLLLSPEEYARRGIELLDVSRGGRATYHGPGQWVIFPVDSLERLTGDRKGVRKIVDLLLGGILEVARSHFPHAEIREGKEAGVWTESGTRGAKLAAFGIRIVDGVVQHGVSINGFATLESFVGLRPCGLESSVAFLMKSGGNEKDFLALRERLESVFLERFPTFQSL